MKSIRQSCLLLPAAKVGPRTTFAVSDVEPATEPLEEIDYFPAVTSFLGSHVESCSCYHGKLLAWVRSHPLIGALHAAFQDHRPVCLSPDMIWLTLTQGLAAHVRVNAESLRRQFVQHEGQENIVVRRDDFIKGSPENPWPEVFSEFTTAIHRHLGQAYDWIVAEFSTTGPVERAAAEIVLMDAMNQYFRYECHSKCGIPRITLEGTTDDWAQIEDRVNEWDRFGLEWWTKHLRPILSQFTAAAGSRVDRDFWESIYKWQGPVGSGSPYVSGWIVNLFPYFESEVAQYIRVLGKERYEKYGKSLFGEVTCESPVRRNPWLGVSTRDKGPVRDDFPSEIAIAPFVWKYFGQNFKMEFLGGFLGIRQDPDSLCLRPEIGWAVRDTSREPYSDPMEGYIREFI
jgi:hypothetical protein